MVGYRKWYLKQKLKLASRQPPWTMVVKDSSTEQEKETLGSIREMEDKDPQERSEAYEFEKDGVEYVEFHVDLLQ